MMVDGVYYDAKGNLLGIDNEEGKTRHDLISRCELFNKLALVPAKDDVNEYASKVYSIIQQMPTVDAEVIVRCKDCKHWTRLKGYDTFGECSRAMDIRPYQNMFCSCGERRSDEN